MKHEGHPVDEAVSNGIRFMLGDSVACAASVERVWMAWRSPWLPWLSARVVHAFAAGGNGL